MLNIFGAKKVIGIDLGSKNLKIVEVSKYKDTFVLDNYIIIEIQAENRLGSILETSQIFVETLGRLIGDSIKGFKSKEVIFVSPILYSFSTYFSLPHMPLNTLKNAVRYESKKYLPLEETEFYIEYRNLEYRSLIEGQSERWFIFFTALPLNFVEKLQRASKIAKLKYLGVDIEYFSHESFFKNSKNIVLLVNIGYSYSYFAIIWEGKVLLAQKMKFNLKEVVRSLANILNVNIEEAENFFINKGFKILPEEEDLKILFNSLIESLVGEINRVVGFLKENFDKKIDKIYFTGGIALADNFLDFLASKLQNIPIFIFNPSDFILIGEGIQNKENLPVLSTAIGSCLNFLLR